MKIALVKTLCRYVASWTDSTNSSQPDDILNPETPNRNILSPITPKLNITDRCYCVIGSTPRSTQERRKGRSHRSKISKSDIGTPCNFQHVGHVAWNPETGLDVSGPGLEVFREVGISDAHLEGDETPRRKLTVPRDKGIPPVRDETKQKDPSQPIFRASCMLIPPGDGTDPLTLPAQTRGQQACTTSRELSPSQQQPGAPVELHRDVGGLSPSPLALTFTYSFCAPVAPPPPPPVFHCAASLPFSPPPSNNPLPEDNIQSSLLNPMETGQSQGAVNDWSLLLNQIRQGCVLKPVTDCVDPKPIPAAEPDGIASALMKVLQKRNRVIHSSNDFEDDDDDDEWDD
ncbi:neural Wiskott-Aldrich syndrome protein-like isoform X2 [Chiloscyllium plagiosum]|uniref:neural Wiskott-Aldrich syndrome protein-like isoform X2 n=1 Tax=Chiloscyllium plagiosum TaxID=36176 RepID=UPI001CB854AF|nr:neural Wiskott-Aldrich syndrome protein-like isoform X2 [Chiloscyllium plagiosum]